MGKKESEFQIVDATLVVSIAPIFASNPRKGVEEMLDSMVMRYIPALSGIVLSHSKLSFLNQTADIKADCPFLVAKVGFEAIVWRPDIGMRLSGRISLCSPDHVSLLVHRTFNVSIPRKHFPTDDWEYEYGAAANDPEFGEHALELPEQTAENKGDDQPTDEADGGRWVHKVTGEPLGGVHKMLEFTVISLTIANEMLSLVGSLHSDPFSLQHDGPENPVVLPTKKTRINTIHPVDGGEGVDAFLRLGIEGDIALAALKRAMSEDDDDLPNPALVVKKWKADIPDKTNNQMTKKRKQSKKAAKIGKSVKDR